MLSDKERTEKCLNALKMLANYFRANDITLRCCPENLLFAQFNLLRILFLYHKDIFEFKHDPLTTPFMKRAKETLIDILFKERNSMIDTQRLIANLGGNLGVSDQNFINKKNWECSGTIFVINECLAPLQVFEISKLFNDYYLQTDVYHFGFNVYLNFVFTKQKGAFTFSVSRKPKTRKKYIDIEIETFDRFDRLFQKTIPFAPKISADKFASSKYTFKKIRKIAFAPISSHSIIHSTLFQNLHNKAEQWNEIFQKDPHLFALNIEAGEVILNPQPKDTNDDPKEGQEEYMDEMRNMERDTFLTFTEGTKGDFED